ncbi:MAG: amino acid adenylation domain-containing protein [Prochloraceae cyanobacterium]|nr:amino acid adenylation domain-containing protein [Prochloraceae cyanobacterium]
MAQLLSPQTVFSLSQVQQVNWFLYQLNPEGLQDKVSLAVRISSTIAMEKVRDIFEQLIDRHPSLRSQYKEKDDRLIQEVYETANLDFKEINANGWSWEELEQQLLDSAKSPFDLEAGSLLRVRLFTRSENDCILLLTLHQLAGDRHSLWVLLSEFLSLYVSEDINSLPSLEKSYRDEVDRELSLLNSSAGEQLKNYWERELVGELPVLSLPTNTSRPLLRTYNGSSCKLAIEPAITRQLQQLAQQQETTIEAILLAAFQVLLYGYTYEEDLLVAILQNRPEFDRVIGNFVNALVERRSISGKSNFKELIQREQGIGNREQEIGKNIDRSNPVFSKATTDDKNYPFPLLVKQLQSSSNSIHSPICQAAFGFYNLDYLENVSQLLEKKATKWGDLELEYIDLPEEKVEFDLTLEAIELQESLLLYFKYNKDFLDDKTITNLPENYDNLLTAILDNYEQQIAKLPVLSEGERKKLLYDWNNTKTDYDLSRCLHQLIETQVEKRPDAVAAVFEDKQITYRELNYRANKLANYLQKQGVKLRDERGKIKDKKQINSSFTPHPSSFTKSEVLVGICVERSLEMVVGLLGILKAGGAYVPIDSGLPQERLRYMLEDSQVPLLLTQKKLTDKLPQHQAEVICLDTDWKKIDREDGNNLVSEVTADNLAYVIYTSGSTGKPKGAMNTHRGICNRLLWMQETYKLDRSDRVLQKTPFSFDVSVWEFFLPLLSGSRLVFAKPGGHTDSAYLVNIIAQQQITTLHFVPSMLQVFLEEKDLERCSSIKRVIASGEALPYELQQRFFARLGCELHNLYGPTEAAIDVTYWECKRNSHLKKVPIGRPVANTQIYILDSYLQPVPIGVPGELHIGGVQVARGYLNRPELTAEKFISNPFEVRGQGSEVRGEELTENTNNSSVPLSPSPTPPLSPSPTRLYKTGDLARYLPDGNIEYIRRIDNQVKIRGFRIELGEIESVLCQHPDIRETTVIARQEKSGGKQLVAYITPDRDKRVQREQGIGNREQDINTSVLSYSFPVSSETKTDDKENNSQTLDPSNIRNFLKERLPEYMVPAAFVVLEYLPLTPNGKVNRRALPEPDISSFSRANNYVSPRDEIEEKLVQIWSQLLNINPVGVKDSFFNLGGHSLLAINLMAKIRSNFGKKLPLTSLFTSPTIEDLANLIRSSSDTSSYSPLVPIQPKGNKSPFFCVHPAGGHVLCYVNLSRYLGDDRPFYGLQAQGFNEGEEALTKVEDMASLYVKAIREFKPEGPYQIGGWSFGGVVAYEIAQQLQKQGQEVSLLVLLDSYVPILLDKNKKIDDVYLVGVLSRVFGGMFGLDNLVSPEELEGLSVEEKINYIIEKARQVGIFPPEVGQQENRRILDVLVGTIKATYAYKRQPYPGKVTVLRAENKHIMASDPQLVWVELFSILDAKEVEIILTPGNHYTFILEPHVRVLADNLASCLS